MRTQEPRGKRGDDDIEVALKDQQDFAGWTV